MTKELKEDNLEKYGGKSYGEVKCPFFTNSSEIPEELNQETICTKCWSLYAYNCYYPKFFDCEQYGEMLKTINPEYLKSLVDALRIGLDIKIRKKIDDNVLFDIVYKLTDDFDAFLESAKESTITYESVEKLITFNVTFRKLKQYAGYLKK